MTPRQRQSVRLVPVDPNGRVLLLLGRDPARPDQPYWFTIGGGVEPGEPPEGAVVRELYEETGIVARTDQLIGPIHREAHAFSYGGVDYISDSTFFAIALDDVVVSFDGLEEGEVGNILDWRWWDPADLVNGMTLSSLELPHIAQLAVAACGNGPQGGLAPEWS